MSPVQAFRRQQSATNLWRLLLLCAAVSGLLVARNVFQDAPHFFHRATVSSHSSHGQRQFFDHEDLLWTHRPGVSLTLPPFITFSKRVPATEVVIATITYGLHYNRPPPLNSI
jgi:hypothetical protein